MDKLTIMIKKVLMLLFVAGIMFGSASQVTAAPVLVKAQPNISLDAYELRINGQVVMRLRGLSDSLPASKRAKVIVQRLEGLNELGSLNSDNIRVIRVNNTPVLMVGNKVIVTMTNADLKANNSSAWDLISIWDSNFKEALKQNPKPDKADKQEKPSEAQPKPDKKEQERSDLTADEQRMLSLVNQERAKIGLTALKIHPGLVKLARSKSKDMIDNNYFSHQSPVYGSPFDMMKSAGIKYSAAGENLAGAGNVDKAHENLMNSAGHRANILGENFTHIGIGIIDGGSYGKMYTQMFIRE